MTDVFKRFSPIRSFREIFVSTAVPLPGHLASAECDYADVQYTLVDCPGHASLMKTIIGGAAIVDLFMLVVDVTKGESLIFFQDFFLSRFLKFKISFIQDFFHSRFLSF